jgi:hypothetical protein
MKPWVKNVLYGLAIIAGGFVLFNVAFMLASLVMLAYNAVARLIFGDLNTAPQELRFSWIYVYLVLVLVLSWFFLRWKRPNDLLKAIYLTMPLMVLLMTIGIALYTIPQWVMAIIGCLILGGVMLYLYKTKRSWVYYFSSIYVGVLALYVMLSGMQI